MQHRVEILGIAEVRWNNCGEHITINGNSLIYSGRTEKRESGVGIMMTKAARASLIDWSPVSDRIIVARLRTRARNVNIIQCYAPTDPDTAEAKDAFYAELAQVLNRTRMGEVVILMGDFNAQVGSLNDNDKAVMGRHGLGRRTDNGERLVELCSQYNLVIGGTIFPHKDLHKYTWKSPRGHTSQIDHICVNKNWRRSLLDVRTRRSADAYTDHELVTAEIRLRVKCTSTNVHRGPKRGKINTDGLKVPPIRSAYTRRLEELSNTVGGGNWQQEMMNIAADTIGLQQRQPKKPWISNATWGLVKDRKQVKDVLNLSDTPLQRAKYNELHKLVQKSSRADKRAYVHRIAKEAEEAAARFDMKDLYRKVKTLSSKKSPNDQPIYDKNGTLLAMEDRQRERWREHFDEVLNQSGLDGYDFASTNTESDNPPANRHIHATAPSLSEIATAIKKLKNGKAAGSDNLPAELFKTSPEIAARVIQPQLHDMWNSERIPSELKEGVIVKLPKKGNLKHCNNWRGITILNTINKILSQIILSRISGPLDDTLRDEQAGFRANRGCVDQSNTLRLIVEQSNEFQAPLYITFVDFEKAFDSINREQIWGVLRKRGIPQKIIGLLRELYRDATCRVLHRGELSDIIPIANGVRQGCVLSPLLFIVALDEIMRETTQTARGIQWTPYTRLEDLDFADDIALLAHTHKDMQDKLDALNAAALKYGLKINITKTKYMRLNASSSRPLSIGNHQLDEVEHFCYLGSEISSTGGTIEDIQSRTAKARATYGRLHNIWKSSKLSRNTKVSIFRSCVLATLLYGSETWAHNERGIAKAQAFVNKGLRRILGIRWPDYTTNTELYMRAGVDSLTKLVHERKWRWIGHALRKPSQSITRQALEWNPQGNRRVGRPRTTWRRSVQQELSHANTTWDQAKQTAPNRTRWRCFTEALRSSWR